MSLSDEILKHVKENSSLNPTTVFNRIKDNYSSPLSVLDEPIGQITSRDQIINPNELVKLDNYRLTRRGKAQYESDLQRAIIYAQQQEAAYKEWFESPEQVYARERAAGRNPDLTDVMEQSSGQVEYNSESPLEGIPTNGEFALNALGSLSSIASVFSTVSSIMGTVSQIGLNQAQEDLVKSQADGQFLSNIRSFVSDASQAISNKLATALSSDDFDIDKFFSGNFDDVLSSTVPSDDPRYVIAFNRILKDSKKVHSDAYAALGEHENRRKMYLEQLSSNYYSPDDDEMSGQLSIVVRANENLHLITTQLSKDIADIKSKYIQNLDPSLAADAFNAQNEYSDEYYTAMNGEIIAKINQAIQAYDATVKKATSDVYKYLNDTFNNPLVKFFPSVRHRVGFEILGGAHMGWQDHMYASGYSEFIKIIQNLDASTFNMISQGNAALQNAATNAKNADTQATAIWLNFATSMANAVSPNFSMIKQF